MLFIRIVVLIWWIVVVMVGIFCILNVRDFGVFVKIVVVLFLKRFLIFVFSDGV